MIAPRANQAGLYRASISVRGHVSPGTVVSLTFAWLDVHEHNIGFMALRLPDGEWPEWVSLQQAGLPPAGGGWDCASKTKSRATGSRLGSFICKRIRKITGGARPR